MGLSLIHISSQEKMVCLIINGKSLPHGEKLVEALRKIDGMTSVSLNCNTERTNVILGHKTIVPVSYTHLQTAGYIVQK